MKNILILITLIAGLIFTSLTKNKTRLLEKELVNLKNEINILNSDLAEATLDFEYLTTPNNISFLAKNFFDESFSYYKTSQIDGLNSQLRDLANLEKSTNRISLNSSILEKKYAKNINLSINTDIQRLSVG